MFLNHAVRICTYEFAWERRIPGVARPFGFLVFILTEVNRFWQNRSQEPMKTPTKIKSLTLILTVTLLACTGLSQISQAAPDVSPPPDGGYPGFTTAEGQNALKNLTTGFGNSAFGWYSLFSVTNANYNTGVGGGTLALNTGEANTATGVASLILNTQGTRN